jgi:hypothetical protein
LSRKIKLRPAVDLSSLAIDHLDIDIAGMVPGKTRVESGGRLPACFANLIGFEGALHDIGDGAPFTARQTMREVARLGAAYRQPRLGHAVPRSSSRNVGKLAADRYGHARVGERGATQTFHGSPKTKITAVRA